MLISRRAEVQFPQGPISFAQWEKRMFPRLGPYPELSLSPRTPGERERWMTKHKPFPCWKNSSRGISQWDQLRVFRWSGQMLCKKFEWEGKAGKALLWHTYTCFLHFTRDFLFQGSRLGPKTQRGKMMSLSKIRP